MWRNLSRKGEQRQKENMIKDKKSRGSHQEIKHRNKIPKRENGDGIEMRRSKY